MIIKSLKSLPGRNIYSHKSVIILIVDLGSLNGVDTVNLDGFNQKLVSLFPGLRKHYCSMGYEGGFVDRLAEGTYIGHVTEHLILELQSLMGFQVFYGKTRNIGGSALYRIIFEYVNERYGFEAARTAVEIINTLSKGGEIDISSVTKRLECTAVETSIGPSTKAVYDEAIRRGIPVTRIGNDSILQLGYGKFCRYFEASMSDSISCIAADIAGNKHLTKQILIDNDIPVPFGDYAFTFESALSVAHDIGYPVVLKPLDGNQGKGVTLDIRDDNRLRSAFDEAMKFGKAVVVERFIKGKDFRVLVVGGKVSAVSERRPPSVTGDSVHTIEQLVNMKNADPLRGDSHEKALTKIKLDNVVQGELYSKGLNEAYIPMFGEEVVLRCNGNLSTGGTACDRTDEIHPINAALAVRAAKAIGLDIAGIDITANDISKPLDRLSGAVVEVNAAPGLRMHLYPEKGQVRDVAGDILEMAFPSGKPCSIPIAAVTGTNGKTTTTRMIAHTLTLAGMKVGMTSTSGIYIGGQCVLKGDNTGPASARNVLSNRSIDAAVLETARGGLVKRGLGYNLADVGVIVNISDDHVGQDGMETLEDIAFVKALVVEAVKPDGYSVLNADDGMVVYLMQRAKGEIILFSKDVGNKLIKRHIAAGGKAVYLYRNTICIAEGSSRTPVIKAAEIPITFGGIVRCNIENSLAAVCALYGMGIETSVIKHGLQTFKPDLLTNPGRFNIFEVGDFRVMLDYSHNTAGYRAVLDFIKRMNAGRLVGVIGMPGDRLNKNINEVGEICGMAFDRLYIKEDSDLRGRDPGEVADILYSAAIKSGAQVKAVEVVYSEQKALETAMLEAKPGDLIVLFYEEFEPALQIIEKIRLQLESNVHIDIAVNEI